MVVLCVSKSSLSSAGWHGNNRLGRHQPEAPPWGGEYHPQGHGHVIWEGLWKCWFFNFIIYNYTHKWMYVCNSIHPSYPLLAFPFPSEPLFISAHLPPPFMNFFDLLTLIKMDCMNWVWVWGFLLEHGHSLVAIAWKKMWPLLRQSSTVSQYTDRYGAS